MRNPIKRDKDKDEQERRHGAYHGGDDADSPKDVAIKTANELAQRFRDMVERRKKEDAA